MLFYLNGGFYVAATLLAIALTVCVLIFITPQKKRAALNPFGKFLHDTFNFNYLIIEKILKTIYIFATAFVIFIGFFMLFKVQPSYFGYGGSWMGGYGIMTMLLGPIVIRVFYELLLLPILLVKHVAQINGKLKGTAENDIFKAPDLTEMKEEIQRCFEKADDFTAENDWENGQ